MGSLLSKPTYVVQIHNRKITLKEYQQIKSYKDALRLAGFSVDNDTTLQIKEYNNHSVFINANEPFKIVESIRYNEHSIYVAKLYGR